jgi:serine/threonine protein phosphatase 1
MNDGRLIAIGDVHGCVHGLEALLNEINPQPADQVVFLGDVIDQGANSREVLDELISLQQRCQLVVIRGNHEEMLFAARDSVEALRFWERCGGAATLNSYSFGGGIQKIPDGHWELMGGCRNFLETERFIFTHANYLADEPMAEHPGHQLRWALFDQTDMRAHYSGKPVIVGHTEQRSGEIADLGFALCIDTAGWRYGWITAIEPATGQVWQASRWGVMREPGEQTPGDGLAKLLSATR